MSYTVTKSDTNTPFARRLVQGGKPLSLSGLTVKVLGKSYDYSTTWITEGTTGITAEPTYTFTAASTGLATHARHKVRDGHQIIVSNSGGALPSGLSASTPYFAVQVTENGFGLATTPGGVSVITGAGSGTNSYYIVGMVLYDWQTADLATTGTYRLYFKVFNGSEYDTFPTAANGTHNPGFVVYVVEPA